ncbi:MAG TPA: helix-turn-helix domain-containing protein [Baekduia sp.]|nr:helix-turn-helix domain-containing protein [Baekduia sp.]
MLAALGRLRGMHEQLPLTPEHRLSRPPSGAEALLDAVAVGQWLGVTTSWVYAETRAGRLPHICVGRYYRYRPSSIEAWLCEQERR